MGWSTLGYSTAAGLGNTIYDTKAKGIVDDGKPRQYAYRERYIYIRHGSSGRVSKRVRVSFMQTG